MDLELAEAAIGSDVDPRAAVRDLKSEVVSRAREIETARRLPADLARKMAESGLFRLYLPRGLGGAEASPMDVVHLIGEMAEADASVAWCFMIGVNTGLLAGYLPSHRAREIFADPLVITASVFAPAGKAVPDGDHYIVTGRWPWASGAENSAWISGGCLLFEDGAMMRDANGAPLHRLMFFPTRDVELIDTWHASGLCGTGSLDFAVTKARVPRDLAVAVLGAPPVESGPLYRFPLLGILGAGQASMALGNAQAALAALRRIAVEKRPQNMGRALAERQVFQAEFARAEARIGSAQAFLTEALGSAWEQTLKGDELSLHDRARLRLACSHAVQSAAETTRTAYELGGGGSVYLDSELQRRFRDAHVVTQHRTVGGQSFDLIGSVLLDQPTDTMML